MAGIWARARIKPATSTVDSCFVLFGTLQYSVGSNNKMPVKGQLFIMLKVVTQYRLQNIPVHWQIKNYELTKQSCWDSHGQSHVTISVIICSLYLKIRRRKNISTKLAVCCFTLPASYAIWSSSTFFREW